MNETLEELAADVGDDTASSVTLSDLKSVIGADSERPQTGRQDSREAVQRYSDTPLTDDDVLAIDEWFGSDQLSAVSDEVVTEYIDEILLVLIAVRGGACGKELLEDVQTVFGTDLSPGTVYPHLTKLADDGTLEIRRLSKRKMYHLSDPGAVFTRVDRTADQLLLFSLVLKTTLDRLRSHSTTSERDQ
jgi:DNA-binding PadR family transcriptional regulator